MGVLPRWRLGRHDAPLFTAAAANSVLADAEKQSME